MSIRLICPESYFGKGGKMKCPGCEAEISSSGTCGICGLLPGEYKAEIEVEYKDFKTSELLEIRHKITEAPEAEESSDIGNTSIGLLQGGNSSASLVMAALILALTLGVYLVFRLLQ